MTDSKFEKLLYQKGVALCIKYAEIKQKGSSKIYTISNKYAQSNSSRLRFFKKHISTLINYDHDI